ncbi:MAG: hypothetical protein ACK56I_24985, partial [bacterium]
MMAVDSLTAFLLLADLHHMVERTLDGSDVVDVLYQGHTNLLQALAFGAGKLPQHHQLAGRMDGDPAACAAHRHAVGIDHEDIDIVECEFAVDARSMGLEKPAHDRRDAAILHLHRG